MLDTSGKAYIKEAIGKILLKAPLRETLAAAMVMLSVWKPVRF